MDTIDRLNAPGAIDHPTDPDAYDPDRSWAAVTPHEKLIARNLRRIPSPLPRAGERILYRHNRWGDVLDAVVVSDPVLDDSDDPNLWEHDEIGRRTGQPHRDPWPLLVLHTAYGLFETREARVRGSAGWLPLGWLDIA